MKETIEKLRNDESILRLIATGAMLLGIFAGACGGVAAIFSSMYSLGVLIIIASVFVSLLVFFLLNTLADVTESVLNTEVACDGIMQRLAVMEKERSTGEDMHSEQEEECDGGDTSMSLEARLYIVKRLYECGLITNEEYIRKLEEICCELKDGEKTLESVRRKIKDPDDLAAFLNVLILSLEADV